MTSDFWNARYSGAEYFYGTEPNTFVADSAATIPAGPVLCLAEGEGRNAVFLASRGHAVTAMDQSPVGLAKARGLAAATGVALHTETGDLADYAIAPAAWSGIVATFVHLPKPLRADVHRRVVAGLRPGGVFILEAYTPAQVKYRTGGPVDQPELLMQLADLKTELADLELLVARELEREVNEGNHHRGLAAVVQVLGRKR
ncbi:MAG TPA: class I SAM-dependent methyltransferase [Opitutus sp.]|nr:class I SAM-dependent methyltransferase [Opitutus sp.]